MSYGYLTKRMDIDEVPNIRLSIVDLDAPDVEIAGRLILIVPEMVNWDEATSKSFFNVQAQQLIEDIEAKQAREEQDLGAAADNVVSMIGDEPIALGV